MGRMGGVGGLNPPQKPAASERAQARFTACERSEARSSSLPQVRFAETR